MTKHRESTTVFLSLWLPSRSCRTFSRSAAQHGANGSGSDGDAGISIPGRKYPFRNLLGSWFTCARISGGANGTIFKSHTSSDSLLGHRADSHVRIVHIDRRRSTTSQKQKEIINESC